MVEGKLQAHSLEAQLGDLQRAVNIRRQLLEKKLSRGQVLKDLPREGMDWKQVHGVCCENVIGFIQIPVGIVGPLLLDGQLVHIPLATTEGALVASTHRGAKAISESGGVTTSVHADGAQPRMAAASLTLDPPSHPLPLHRILFHALTSAIVSHRCPH